MVFKEPIGNVTFRDFVKHEGNMTVRVIAIFGKSPLYSACVAEHSSGASEVCEP